MVWKQYRDTNYEVSNTGLVRNKNTKKVLAQYKKNSGKYENDYLRVSMYINSKDILKSVHRLVAECFLDDYREDLEVNHKNFIRYDNRVENIEMCTKEENFIYSVTNNRTSKRKPVKAISITTGEEFSFSGLWSAGKFVNNVLETHKNIDHICNNIKNNIKGKSKSSYGYRWEFI